MRGRPGGGRPGGGRPGGGRPGGGRPGGGRPGGGNRGDGNSLLALIMIPITLAIALFSAIIGLITGKKSNDSLQEPSTTTGGTGQPFDNNNPSSVTKKKQKKSSFILNKIALVIAFLIGLFYLIVFINTPSKEYEYASTLVLPMICCFIVFGILLLILILRIATDKYLSESVKERYVYVINNNSDLSIKNIASQMKYSEKRVLRDLDTMMQLGFFPNCYIDTTGKYFCFPKTNKQKATLTTPIVVECASCGAKATLYANTVRKCEYCGNPLSTKNAVTK